MEISLAISPCPNDTFIFDYFLNEAMIQDVKINVSFHDIETLNQGAKSNRWDIVKVSCAIHNQLPEYTMLRSGGAMGDAVGPILIAKKNNIVDIHPQMSIAVPGINTTAYRLLQFFYNFSDEQIIEINFAKIEQAVLLGKVDLGLIIHESRFTYAKQNLFSVADLGTLWQAKTKLPVPLGCIMMRNHLYEQVGETIHHEIQNSLQYAWSAYPKISNFVKSHAQTMQEKVMRAHIELYVNNFSMNMGTIGEQAISTLNAKHIH